jgi:N utilization substance protein B
VSFETKKSLARSSATQALYQWQVTGDEVTDIVKQFREEQDKNVDQHYFRELVLGVHAKQKELDDLIVPFLDRDILRVDLVERAILRLGTYELAFKPEVPFKVVINEAVELAKSFGADQSHKYINGVLDKLAAKLRPVEMKAKKS